MKKFWIVAILALLAAGCDAGSTIPNVPNDLTERAKTCFNSGFAGMLVEVQQITVVSEGDTLYWSITTSCVGRRITYAPPMLDNLKRLPGFQPVPEFIPPIDPRKGHRT